MSGRTATKTRRGARVRTACLVALAALWIPWAATQILDLSPLGWVSGLVEAGGVYAFAVATVALTIAGVARQPLPGAVAALGVAYVGACLIGRVWPDPQPNVPAGGTHVTVAVLNLDQGRADPEEVVRVLRSNRVEVVALLELTPTAATRLATAGLNQTFPFMNAVTGDASGGLGAFSRHKTNWDADLLPPPRPWMPVVVRTPDTAFRFEAVHAIPPRPKTRREYESDTIWGDLPPPNFRGLPAIIAGDLNATLDSRRLKQLMAKGYRDAAAETGAALSATWVGAAGLARLSIDHVLVPPDVAVDDVATIKVRGTDHRAVVARLTVPTRPG